MTSPDIGLVSLEKRRLGSFLVLFPICTLGSEKNVFFEAFWAERIFLLRYFLWKFLDGEKKTDEKKIKQRLWWWYGVHLDLEHLLVKDVGKIMVKNGQLGKASKVRSPSKRGKEQMASRKFGESVKRGCHWRPNTLLQASARRWTTLGPGRCIYYVLFIIVYWHYYHSYHHYQYYIVFILFCFLTVFFVDVHGKLSDHKRHLMNLTYVNLMMIRPLCIWWIWWNWDDSQIHKDPKTPKTDSTVLNRVFPLHQGNAGWFQHGYFRTDIFLGPFTKASFIEAECE